MFGKVARGRRFKPLSVGRLARLAYYAPFRAFKYRVYYEHYVVMHRNRYWISLFVFVRSILFYSRTVIFLKFTGWTFQNIFLICEYWSDTIVFFSLYLSRGYFFGQPMRTLLLLWALAVQFVYELINYPSLILLVKMLENIMV